MQEQDHSREAQLDEYQEEKKTQALEDIAVASESREKCQAWAEQQVRHLPTKHLSIFFSSDEIKYGVNKSVLFSKRSAVS